MCALLLAPREGGRTMYIMGPRKLLPLEAPFLFNIEVSSPGANHPKTQEENLLPLTKVSLPIPKGRPTINPLREEDGKERP